LAGVLVAIGALLLVLAAAAFRVTGIQDDLLAARDRLNAAERLLRAGRPAQARAALAVARNRVVRANSTLYGHPELALLKAVPIGRQNMQSLEDSVGVALRLATAGDQILNTARPLEAANGQFEVPMRSGAVPLSLIDQLRPQLADLAASLPQRGDAPKSRLIVGPLRSLQRNIYRQAELRQHQAASLTNALDLLTALSGGNGPRRFLIAVANAAEMRGTGGMILSYGEMTSKDGTFALEHFGNIDELQSRLKTAVTPPTDVPADYLQRFAGLDPAAHFRNANLGADFRDAALLLEAMYTQATGKPVDGVLQIDSMGLAAMMRGTGPVDSPGLGTVNAGNVVRVTLSDAYARFPNERSERQEVLGDVAEAVFRKLVTGDYASLRPLAHALVNAAAERRLQLHMTRTTEQDAVNGLAINGALADVGDVFALTVQNFSGNKLDYYVDSALNITGQRRPGALGEVTAELTVTNHAVPGQLAPAYVFGPFNSQLAAGQYSGLASLYLPAGSSLVSSTGSLGGSAPGASTEGGHTVIGIPVNVGAGQQVRISLRLQLPPSAGPGYAAYLVPASRVLPTRFTVDLFRGAGRPRVRYDATAVKPVAVRETAAKG
jgi:hypothetical protein